MTSIRSSVLLIVAFSSFATGIVLPGPCPLLKPSDELTDRLYSESIISSVPFARKSYLFRDILVAKDPHCHSLTSYDSVLIFNYGGLASSCQFVHLSQIGFSADNASHIFDSEVHLLKMNNFPTIKENIRVWFVNEKGAIIWSCDDGKYGKEHDEAPYVWPFVWHVWPYDDDFGHKVNNLRSNITLFLKRPLLERIIWLNNSRREICRSESEYVNVITITIAINIY